MPEPPDSRISLWTPAPAGIQYLFTKADRDGRLDADPNDNERSSPIAPGR